MGRSWEGSILIAFWSTFKGFGVSWGVLEASWGSWRGSWGPGWFQEPSRCNFWKIWPQLGGQVGVPKFYLMLQNFPKRPPGAIQGRCERVSKKDLNIEGTEDRFFIDVGSVLEGMLGGPKTTKHWPAWFRKHFRLFLQQTSFNRLLGSQKHRFW